MAELRAALLREPAIRFVLRHGLLIAGVDAWLVTVLWWKEPAHRCPSCARNAKSERME
jgi:hypothetical protein